MVYDRQNWRAKARCSNLTSEEAAELFYISKGKSANPARQFCGGCPVQSQCLDYAIYYGEVGIWGGTTDDERKRLSESLVGLLTVARIESNGVNTTETRDQTQWGMGTRQILESRRQYSRPQPAYPSEPVVSEPRPQDRLPLMLVVEL